MKGGEAVATEPTRTTTKAPEGNGQDALPPVTNTQALAKIPEKVADRIARQDNGPQGYEGASTGTTTADEDKALMAPFDPEAYEIKPTEAGEIYVGQTHVRRRLNQVFGALGWALIPIPTDEGKLFSRDGSGDREVVLMRGRLYVRGHFRSDHIGEQALSHDRMTYATACEAAQSDTLTRCAKDLSIGWECWDKRWCEEWRKKFAVRVMVKKGKGDAKTVWRRKDAAKLYGEIAVDAGDIPPAHVEGQTVEPLITKQEIADLWAIVTEVFPRQKAQQMAKDVISRFGFHKADEITKAKLPAVIKAIREAGE